MCETLKDWNATRERYLRDPVPIRLGGIAANLARVKSFSTFDENSKLVEGLLEESKYFIEWTAAETDIEVAAQLAELQIQLAFWQHNWERNWTNLERRSFVVTRARLWSDRLLEMSGLLEEE
jgi:hypothetical protein